MTKGAVRRTTRVGSPALGSHKLRILLSEIATRKIITRRYGQYYVIVLVIDAPFNVYKGGEQLLAATQP